jgi:histidine ammonia-lyase
MDDALITLDGTSLTLSKAAAIAAGAPIGISEASRSVMEPSHQLVKRLALDNHPVYGINTGFGFLANKCIAPAEQKLLQLNLIKSHAGGYGTPLSIPETRLAMALRINVLLKGYTGVRFELVEALLNLIKAEIYPIIPEKGSVGASGDLAPLAHLALPLLGLGRVHYRGQIIEAAEALSKAKLRPIELMEKEGLALINGTQIMLSVGGLALETARRLLLLADNIAALSYEAVTARPSVLYPKLHQLRNQKGQIASAKRIAKQLNGSYLYNPKTKHLYVQDPYSIRCAPQVHGASRDAIVYACTIAENELNAATDNPLVFVEEQQVISGGNFHGQPLALAFDFASIAIAEIGNISERRLDLLLNPHMNKLTAFLSPNPGINSGYMILQYLSAANVNENKLLANPSSTDSIPGNANIEDHVSMGMTSANKFKKIVLNAKVILAAELLAAAQAIDLRKASPLGKGTASTYNAIRKKVPMLEDDRIIHDDISASVALVDELLATIV